MRLMGKIMAESAISLPLLIADAKTVCERYCRESAIQSNASAALRYRNLWNYMI